MTLLWCPKNYFMNFSSGLGLLVARTATYLWLPIAWAPAHLTWLYFISKIFTKFFLLIFELIMVPDFSLNIFPEGLAVRTDTGHQNSRLCGIATGRMLQICWGVVSLSLRGVGIDISYWQNSHITIATKLAFKWPHMKHCMGGSV